MIADRATSYAARSVSTATSASVPSPARRVTPENPTPEVTYNAVVHRLGHASLRGLRLDRRRIGC